MAEHPRWHLERFTDEMDPFSLPQFYVMHGSVLIAQCEIEAHAEAIIEEHVRLGRYQHALDQISRMTPDGHDLGAAVAEASRALGPSDHGPTLAR